VSLYEKTSLLNESLRLGFGIALDNHSTLLADAGEYKEALRLVSKALKIYRDPHPINSDDGKSASAAALANYARLLPHTEERDAALSASRDAVARLQQSTERHPSNRANLAGALSNYSNRLYEAGRDDEGLAIALAAVDQFRMVDNPPPEVRSSLALALSNLAGRLASSGCHNEEPRRLLDEAIEIFQDLHRDFPAICERDFLRALENRSIMYANAGDHQGAVTLITKAIELAANLATDDPQPFSKEHIRLSHLRRSYVAQPQSAATARLVSADGPSQRPAKFRLIIRRP
jgi:tetratricopeptide (TPR) repeat protein